MKPRPPEFGRIAARCAAMALAWALLATCGKRETDARAPGLSDGDSAVLQSTARMAFSGQGTVRMARRPLADTLEAPARIEADERISVLVVAPAEGRLEAVDIRTPEQWLRQGERIALLYSPELVAAQRELLLLPAGDARMAAIGEERLLRMGLTAAQIRSLRASGKPMERIPVLSPKAGYALARAPEGMPARSDVGASQGMGAGMGDAGMGDGMGSSGGMAGEARPMTEASGDPGTGMLRAGMPVSRGSVLARINDLSRVAVQLALPVRSASAFKAGDAIHLAIPSVGFEGPARLDYLESRVTDSSGNVQATAYLPNPGGKLKLGSLGMARVIARPETAWALPRTAVHALGERQIVWARADADTALFEAREVRVGRAGGGYVEILDGLGPEAAVALNASLLLDPDVVLEPIPLGAAKAPAPDGHAAHGREHRGTGPSGAEHAGHSGHGEAGRGLRLGEAQARLAGIRTAMVDSMVLAPSQVFRAMVRLDDRAQAAVSARVEGRVEQSGALRVGERVASGQVLAHLNSEAFLAAQEEYLVARRSASALGEGDLVRGQVEAARRRLSLMGMSPGRIAGLEKEGRAQPRLPVTAPRDGILAAVNARSGQYVRAGQDLFTVGRIDPVWVETWLLASEAATYPEGTEASIRVEGLPGRSLSGKLDHIRSGTSLAGSVTLAHIGLPNPDGSLLPGMQAWVEFRQKGRKTLGIAPSALLPAKGSAMVWVETAPYAYEPRMVETGLETPDGVEIRSGLEAGESVVVSGAYLLNSEFIIRKGAGKVHAGH